MVMWVVLGIALLALLIGCARFAVRPARGATVADGTDAREPSPATGALDTGMLRDLRAVRGRAGGILPADLAAPTGALVLLQLSSAFCSSCRDTRSVLGDVAADVPGLVHRDVDLAARPELVRLLAVVDTPTTLLVDPDGIELLRIAGVPRRAALTAALAPHLPPAGFR